MTTEPSRQGSLGLRLLSPENEEEREAIAVVIAFAHESLIELAIKTIDANLGGAEDQVERPAGTDVFSSVIGRIKLTDLQVRRAVLENYLQAVRSHSELTGIINRLAVHISNTDTWPGEAQS